MRWEGCSFRFPPIPQNFIHNHPSSVFHRPSSTTRQLQLLASPPFAIPTQRRPQLGCGKVLGHFTRPSDCAPATDVTCLGFSSSKNCLMASIPRTSRETETGTRARSTRRVRQDDSEFRPSVGRRCGHDLAAPTKLGSLTPDPATRQAQPIASAAGPRFPGPQAEPASVGETDAGGTCSGE